MRHVFQMQAPAESMYGITIEEATKNLASGRTDDILDLIFRRYEVRQACFVGWQDEIMWLHWACYNADVSLCHLADSSKVCHTPSSPESSALRLCPDMQQRCIPLMIAWECGRMSCGCGKCLLS